MSAKSNVKNCGVLKLFGAPNPKQKEFFQSTARYTAYGGSRGGGKSWALRRKLVLMAFNYPGIRILLVRRSFPEIKENHLFPLLSELSGAVEYKESSKTFIFPGGSVIILGYCDAERDVLRYQGQEYDVIALDEATQLTEYQFSTFKACLRGANSFPKRMYLTCNPGGVGHSWVKRLFIDCIYKQGEKAEDYRFIPARVYDNSALLKSDPEYVDALKSLPGALRKAWLDGDWNVFEGQFFPEFSRDMHITEPYSIPRGHTRFAALDYGFDMLAVLWIAVLPSGELVVYRELAISGLTLTRAAQAVVENTFEKLSYVVASPDLWNRRQDSGESGVCVMSRVEGMPPIIKADDRRIAGWRALREVLATDKSGEPKLKIFSNCTELTRCLESLLYDRTRPEDASSTPHAITHLPEALRYGVMSYASTAPTESEFLPHNSFFSPKKRSEMGILSKNIANY